MTRLLKDPLFLFLLIGAGLFGLNAMVQNPNDFQDEKTIQITQGDMNNIKSLFEKQWKRSPTDEELENMIAAHVREQVFYREALTIGLEKDDTIIRRRLVQKMEFIFGDLGASIQPDEQELDTFYQTNKEKYQSPARFSLTQLYINPDLHGEFTEQKVTELLETLESVSPEDSQVSKMGDRIMLEIQFQDASWHELARRFGNGFPVQIEILETGKWAGPVTSGFGYHVVYLESMTPPQLIPLEEIRDQVLRDYQHEKRKQAELAAYEKLKSNYRIILEFDANENS